MSLIFKARFADQRTKDIVFGFIKQSQNLFNKNSIYHNIPSLVHNLCLNYFWISEYFTLHGSDITLNKDKNIAKVNKENSNGTVYGNVDIDINALVKYEWIFETSGFEEICIGIDSSNKQYPDKDYTDPVINKFNFYAYYNGGNKFFCGSDRTGTKYGDSWEDDQKYIIKMILNVPNKTLEYYVDNESEGIAFDNIDFNDKEYNMAVYTNRSDKESVVQLLDFKMLSLIERK